MAKLAFSLVDFLPLTRVSFSIARSQTSRDYREGAVNYVLDQVPSSRWRSRLLYSSQDGQVRGIQRGHRSPTKDTRLPKSVQGGHVVGTVVPFGALLGFNCTFEDEQRFRKLIGSCSGWCPSHRRSAARSGWGPPFVPPRGKSSFILNTRWRPRMPS